MPQEPEDNPATVFHTALEPRDIRERLIEANRRGKLPEITCPDDSTISLTLPTRPLVAHLDLHLEPNATGTRITWTTRIEYRLLWIAILVNLVLIVLGPWSTEIFFNIYSWYWQPPLYVLTAIWIAWTWPRKSKSDIRALIGRWLSIVAGRIEASTI